MEGYTEALEAEMQGIGGDTFLRSDENGIEHVCFLIPVNDDGDDVFVEMSVFGMNEYFLCLQVYCTVAHGFGGNLPGLEKAVGLWNGSSFGAYVIHYPGQSLHYRHLNILSADSSPQETARMAFYSLALAREEINARLPEILEFISVEDGPGAPGDIDR